VKRRQLVAGAASIWVAACAPARKLPRLLLVGDSTVASYPSSKAPLAGWGQALSAQLEGRAKVLNYAVPGNSTRRFAAEHWHKVRSNMTAGDQLLIQFGHVDASADPNRHAAPDGLYRTLLTQFVTVAQLAGAYPILITPIARFVFTKGKVLDTHGRYLDVVREVAVATGSGLIDLALLSTQAMEKMGEIDARLWFMVAHDGVDAVHLNTTGASAIAKIVATALEKMH